jgi:hypothetical protein
MHSFKDTAGRTWNLSANLGLYLAIKSEFGLDLGDLAYGRNESIQKIASDMFLTGAVLWKFVERQAAERGVTVEDFYSAFDGGVIEEALKALAQEQIFFCPPQTRKLLETAWAAAADHERTAVEQLDAALPAVAAEMRAALDGSKTGVSSPTSSQASSASIPGSGAFAGSTSLPVAGSERTGTTPAPSSPRSRKRCATRRSGRSRTTPHNCTR